MTVAELAKSIRQTQAFTREMLHGWKLAGIASVDAAGRWRLTEFGFERFGRGLLEIDLEGTGSV